MKILLIQPSSVNMIKTNVPKFTDEETGSYPALGLLFIAAYLEKYSSHSIEVLDCIVEKISSYDALEEEIRKRNPDIVGIQMMSFTVRDALLTARTVKKIDKNIPVIVGGPHPNIYINETISFDEIDYIVLGEGEKIFTELVQRLADGKDVQSTNGVVSKHNGKITVNGEKGFIEDLDSLPFPARHLTPYKKYNSILSKHDIFTTMVSSRGCPFRCLFCDRAYFGKIYKMRSAENVVREMELCQEMGIQEIDLQDDLFTLKKDRVSDICDLLISKKSRLKWNVRARVDTVDKEILKKMADAGCQRIYFGIEAGTPEIQKVLRKNIDLEQAKKVFNWAKDCNISTLAYIMIGMPEETRSHIHRTIKYMKDLKPDFVHIAVLTPFPSTDAYIQGLEKGLYKNDHWREYAQNPFNNFTPRYWDEILTREELFELLNFAYRSFYLRPTYILSELLKVKNRNELWRKIRGGLKLAVHT
ncbi:MAG: radical SAM protein [Thermodesulfovibrionia bacterium]|nr:radical SAM protein [Thermodesulfovibrionia bacterium]